jgi:hypothetical protein
MGMKRIVGVVVAGMVLAGTSQVASAQSSNTDVFNFRGSSADAIFRTSEGCIKTEVDVIAGESMAVAPAQPTRKQDSAIVLLDRRNTCTGELLVFGGGVGFDVVFEIGPLLSSAEVHGVVPVNDVVSGRTLDVTVDVVWTGVGELERGANHAHFVDDGVVVWTHDNGSFRHATAVGHVVEDTTELVPNGSSTDSGFLAWSNFGQVLIDRGA